MSLLDVWFDSLSKTDREFVQNELDERVHEAKAEEAANINNEGMSAQVEYLGYTVDKMNGWLANPEAARQ